MSRLTIGQKANRVLKFMLGMRHRQVTSAMAVHGFTPEELDNGWELLRELVGDRLGYSAADRGTADAITALDAWENRWFPIIRASLDRHFPEVAERVFFNLRQTEGPQVVVGVDTLLRRIRVAGTEAGGEAVLDLLARRGLDEAELRRVEGLVAQLAGFLDPGEPTEAESAAMRDAEDRLWAWYREWSTIARAVVDDRRLLRAMGFLRYRPGSPALVEVDDEEGLETATAAPELEAPSDGVDPEPTVPAPSCAPPRRRARMSCPPRSPVRVPVSRRVNGPRKCAASTANIVAPQAFPQDGRTTLKAWMICATRWMR